MAGKRAQTLLEMMFFIRRFTLERAWAGLTDDEFLWEPTPSTWSVRPLAEIRTSTPFVNGDLAADFDSSDGLNANWAVDGEPLTNIAWLYWHVASVPGRTAELDFLGGVHTAASGWSSPYIALHPMFLRADEAVSAFQSGWHALTAALQSATDEQLEAPLRFWGYGGEGPAGTGAQVVAGAINEISHHATQIATLRDVYKVRGMMR